MVAKLKHTWRSLTITERTLLYIAFILTLAVFAWVVEFRAGI